MRPKERNTAISWWSHKELPCWILSKYKRCWWNSDSRASQRGRTWTRWRFVLGPFFRLEKGLKKGRDLKRRLSSSSTDVVGPTEFLQHCVHILVMYSGLSCPAQFKKVIWTQNLTLLWYNVISIQPKHTPLLEIGPIHFRAEALSTPSECSFRDERWICILPNLNKQSFAINTKLICNPFSLMF